MDDNMYNYLNNLEKKGHLEETIVYILGDHGNHFRLLPI